MLVRPMVQGDAPISRAFLPGDLMGSGGSLTAGAIATAGAGTWTGAAMATGIIYRTGPVGGYTDTTDTATNILAALAGNAPAADIVPGTSFRMVFVNTVAQAMTFAAGTGVLAGTGTLDCAASLVREYIVTILNATPAQTLSSNTTNASKAVTFNFSGTQTVWPMGLITPGMVVSGTGITAGTRVDGITMGQGGITGVHLDTNATATSSGGVALTFGPYVQIDSIRAGTL